jgi:hypothetical protein
MTNYLRFPDETTGMDAIRTAGFIGIDEDGLERIINATHEYALDLIGPIHTGGQYNPETGEQLVAPTLQPGWHVNHIGELPDGWGAYLVYPQNPVRIFADGGGT